jgi:hypothetical protein
MGAHALSLTTGNTGDRCDGASIQAFGFLAVNPIFFSFFFFSGLDVGSLPDRLASLRTASRSDFSSHWFLQSLTHTCRTVLAMVAHCGRRLSAQCTSCDPLFAWPTAVSHSLFLIRMRIHLCDDLVARTCSASGCQGHSARPRV